VAPLAAAAQSDEITRWGHAKHHPHRV